MRVGIVTAMSSEREQICRLLKNAREVEAKGSGGVATTGVVATGAVAPSARKYHVGEIGPNEIFLAETGIGKVNATIGAVELIRAWRPDCLISTGVAGGIDASLGLMDVVVGAEVAYHDVDCGPGNVHGQVQGLPPRFPGDKALLACAVSLRTESRIVPGLICSGDLFVSTPEQRNAIKALYPDGLAVEMESAALAQVCHLYGVPFVSFRIISDTPGVKDHFDKYLDFWGTMADRSFAVTRAFLESLPGSLAGA